jgi:putative flavoprotein involved in K+ transport
MTHLPDRIETIVVGAGHAGLSASALLRDAGREHLVLERRERLGGGWLDRWDAFRLVSPNWTTSFPGFPYADGDPDGFMTRDEVVGRIVRYAAAIEAPVALDTGVERLERRPDAGDGFRLTTTRGPIDADRVIVATGGFQDPRIPSGAAGLAPSIHQLHAATYRNPDALPSGAVLVVGSGQTGVQIAEELRDAGRSVFLSVGRCGRVPRRYRGRDYFVWLWSVRMRGPELGLSLLTMDTLPDPRIRFACNPQLSGHGGGHETNLRRFAAEGITLVGRFEAFDGSHARFAPDLATNLEFADRFFEQRQRPLFDAFIERAGIDAPPDDREPFAYEPPEVTELDLAAAGVSTVIWTSGFRLDLGWIDLPVLDPNGVPRQRDGLATGLPGLGFVGLPWQRDQASATLFGAGRDAEVLVERLEEPGG